MPSRVIAEDRIQKLNSGAPNQGEFTLYWMQRSARAELNHALEYAIQRANEVGNRLVVCFALTDDYPEANLRHYRFLLEGLAETQRALRRRGVPLAVRRGNPPDVISELGEDATELICDRGYLRHERAWREEVAQRASCPVWQVESDAIVPVEVASDHQEYAARTIRPKLDELIEDYLEDLATTPIDKHSLNLGVSGIDVESVDDALSSLDIDRSVSPTDEFEGGTRAAKRRLRKFLKSSLSKYDQRTDVVEPHVSALSPYLHFGHISPLAIALEVKGSKGHRRDAKAAFLEELLVRRELAINFVYYCDEYDSLGCLPNWARTTLSEHENDEREHRYTKDQLDRAETHDRAWNAAMREMKHRGYLHNHLRMYWGKKIIEWTNTTRYAHRVALELNNRYFLDGRDASSYANVAWLFGLHDRAFQERDVFGKVRYMSARGLERKLDVDAYVASIDERYPR